MNEDVAGFLIDECLSFELADLAREHGYHALATTRMWKLRKRDDYRVAKYALDHNLILVTNDMYDLEDIYDQFEVHPGVVFITAGRSKLRTLDYQLKMFTLALDEIEDIDPMSQAILVTAKEQKGRGRRSSNVVALTIKCYAHPNQGAPKQNH